MSYYDFNDHFWSPKTVCIQSSLPNSNKKNTRRSKLIKSLYMVNFAISILLLFDILVIITNQNQDKTAIDTTVNHGQCFTSRSDNGLQIYCPNPY